MAPAQRSAKAPELHEVVERVADPAHLRGLVETADEGSRDLADRETAPERPHHDLGVPEPSRVVHALEQRQQTLPAEELVPRLRIVERDTEQALHEPGVAAAHDLAVEGPDPEEVDAAQRGHVGAFLDGFDEGGDVPAVDLQVDVDVAGDLAACGAEAVADRRTSTLVLLVKDDAQVLSRMRRDDASQELAGAVAAHVVDEQDLPGPAEIAKRLEDLADALLEHVLLVVAGEHEAEVGRARHGQPRLSRTASMTRSTSASFISAWIGRRTSVEATRSLVGKPPWATPSERPNGEEWSGT